jgi:FMN-dependent NADH-azoreductase
MKKLLVIKSSLFANGGQSGALIEQAVEAWRRSAPSGEVVVRDLAQTPPPHLSERALAAFSSDDVGGDQADMRQQADSLIRELKEADEVIIGLPMYNFTVPSTFKAWMDYVARAGTTFRYTENGPEGLLKDRPVTIVATRGGYYQGTESDTQTPMIKLFFGMLGITSVRFVYAEGLALGDEVAKQSLAQASAALTLQEAAA